MAYTPSLVDLLAYTTLVIVIIALEKRRRQKGRVYPPGPRPLPLIGNLLDVPKEHQWFTFTEWARKYGEIVYAHVLGKTIIVVSSTKAIRELLEKRATNYSDRPVVPFFEIMEFGGLVVMDRYSPHWRLRRKMLDRTLRPNCILRYRDTIKMKVHDLLKQLLADPEEFREHLELLQGAILLSVVYGYDVDGKHDSYLQRALAVNEIGTKVMLPGAALVNDLPFLKNLPEWLPGMGWMDLARQGRKARHEAVTAPFKFVKDRMENGTARPSVTHDNIIEVEHGDPAEVQEGERAIAESSASLYFAGADSTSAALASLFLALVLHPEVQTRAQAEVDAATGGKRLPTFEDRPQMPYVDAVCKELLRWNLVAPSAVPHAAMEEDTYNGYYIPKGAIIIANLWAILHDPIIYPDPDSFKPNRFLPIDGVAKEEAISTLNAAFGIGRRICPGRHLVDPTVFITVASVVASFSVSKAMDEDGNEIPVTPAYSGGVLSHPMPFKCSIVPRVGKEALILAPS
ncbi:cytochrome P450 [Artomyces pyxidatus]|uniref:Cytochrome P450 n=1 Tax=Artomyces pyxidatus TaxID=48021 RepID=A0ACB8TDW9_9AGAM|nr:cytochrome P450 [Artomyces pyxidatus]